MLMMGCHCSWQHPRLTNLRKYYLSPLHLTSNQSHQKFQRGANDETSSQFEVWGPTDGSRLVAWEELTLLPAPSFSPQPPLLLPSCSTKREAGSEKARDPAAIQPLLLPLLEVRTISWGGEELGQEEPSMGVVGSVFGGAAWETSLMLRPGTYLRPFWTISLI